MQIKENKKSNLLADIFDTKQQFKEKELNLEDLYENNIHIFNEAAMLLDKFGAIHAVDFNTSDLVSFRNELSLDAIENTFIILNGVLMSQSNYNDLIERLENISHLDYTVVITLNDRDSTLNEEWEQLLESEIFDNNLPDSIRIMSIGNNELVISNIRITENIQDDKKELIQLMQQLFLEIAFTLRESGIIQLISICDEIKKLIGDCGLYRRLLAHAILRGYSDYD